MCTEQCSLRGFVAVARELRGAGLVRRVLGLEGKAPLLLGLGGGVGVGRRGDLDADYMEWKSEEKKAGGLLYFLADRTNLRKPIRFDADRLTRPTSYLPTYYVGGALGQRLLDWMTCR